MKYQYDGDSGFLPNIGVFNRGDEVPADVAQKLKTAGYAVLEVADKKPKAKEGEEA